MNLISNSDYISTSALYGPSIQHGLISWIKHRYVRREGTPGNYRYIYPEDLKKRREARRAQNIEGATLFGSRTLRRMNRDAQAEARAATSQQRRTERSLSREQRRLDRDTKAYRDPSTDFFKRPTLRKRIEAAKKHISGLTMQKAAQDRIAQEARAKADRYLAAYNSSRLIDDVAADVVDFGAAYFNAFVAAVRGHR